MSNEPHPMRPGATAVEAPCPLPGRSIAVCSGKGGVGKTTLSANLAVLAAEHGRDVLLVDLDLGLSNLDVLFRLPPGQTIRDLLHGVPSARCIRTGPAGLRILPGASGHREMTRLRKPEIHRVLRLVGAVDPPPDLTILDVAAGIGDAVVEALLAVDAIVLVTTPEPAAVTDAYALVKILAAHDRTDRIHLTINHARTNDEAFRTAAKIRNAAERFLGKAIDQVGWILRDDAVTRASLAQRLVVRSDHRAPAVRAIRFLASKLIGPGKGPGRTAG